MTTKNNISLYEIDFGQPEAELDRNAISESFYEAESWRLINSKRKMPFVIGRKGSGKSAIAAKLEIESEKDNAIRFLSIVPADFRHVEIRPLLQRLVNKEASWQYIYSKVWEGIILGQLIKFVDGLCEENPQLSFSNKYHTEVNQFKQKCGFYTAALEDALSDVIVNYVEKTSKKTDEVSLVELRKMLEPYNWTKLVPVLGQELSSNEQMPEKIFIAIDGLDEHWDNSEPSLFFLAQLLTVTNKYTAALFPKVKFVICLRDNIFRSLVDTKSIEYDKLESSVVNLEWNGWSLLELIAKRVAPGKTEGRALAALYEILPESVDGESIEEYLSQHLLNRPRDYINYFIMLQSECGTKPKAGVSDIRDTTARYCANRLVDLENEFGFIYPGISKCISVLAKLNNIFRKEDLLIW